MNYDIIIIEDNPDHEILLRDSIESMGNNIRIKSFSCAEDFLIFDQSLPKVKLIFLDIMLPDLDGKELLKLIDRSRFPNVIIHTTSNLKSDKDDCINAGANVFLVKTFDFKQLNATIKDILTTFQIGES